MSIPTTILALYPFFMFFLQAAAPPAAEETGVVEVAIRPAGKGIVQSILPNGREKNDAAGASDLLREAFQSVPPDPSPVDMNWLSGPIEEFPAEEAEQILAGFEPTLRKLGQALGGGEIAWDPPPGMDELGRVRSVARLIALKARLQISRGQFEAGTETLGTGYALARAMTAPGAELIHAMVGVATGALMTEQLLTITQQANGPSLLGALRALPDPLVDIEPALESERSNLRAKVPNPLTRRAMAGQLEPAHARARQLAGKLRGQIAAVRILEELRVKSAGSGELPAKLDVAMPATRPADRITLQYMRIAADEAELTVATGEPAEHARYVIDLLPAGSQ